MHRTWRKRIFPIDARWNRMARSTNSNRLMKTKSQTPDRSGRQLAKSKKKYMKKQIQLLTTLLLFGFLSASCGSAQDEKGPAQKQKGPTASGEAPDQISRLAEMVGLSDEQESKIRGVIDEKSPQIEQLQQQAQALQGELDKLSGPDYDEAAIRAKADELGVLQGKMTAESILLQSEIDSIFTAEQREELEAMQRRQQQMQQQQMQQQMQRQMQQQMQQQQKQQKQEK